MVTYEEEGEIIPDCVINYFTVDGNYHPVPFSVLPLVWSEDETPGNSDTQIFLCGTAVTGQDMYEKIIAWRPDISYAFPMIYVLSKNKLWMQLQRPTGSFEDYIISTLITVHCLHFLKWNLKADRSALWTHLHKAFSTYDVLPSKRHLSSHLPLIKEAAKRDKDLAKSELLPTLLLETRTCKANRATRKITFEADVQEDYGDTDGDDHDGTFDSVCVLCDDGGKLLRCEDKCLRSFHPNINAGVNSCCESLGFSFAQVEAMQTFFCNNCQYQQHQCFVCGKLGSSDQCSAPEVFQCANGDCGHFYHPNCVAELLQRCDTLKTKELQLKIHSGEAFVCPAHKCSVCMKGEDKAVHELQFAMCRRCPKAYHRKCLPREITFRGDGKNDQRAWDGLLLGRILIYCMDHEILSDIGTPRRDHIIFPNVEANMQTNSGLLSSKEKLIKSRDMANFAPRSPLKQRFNHAGIYRRHSTSATFTGKKIFGHTGIGKSNLSMPQRPMYLPSSSNGKISDYLKQSANKFMKVKGSRGQPAFDSELKSRMLKLIEDSMSSYMEESLKGKKSSSLYSSNARITEDKTFTEGKVKGYVKAVQSALKILNLNDGGKLEDAKAVCEPQKHPNIYLAPSLHGKRYTYFGRHFTKVSKLELIVDKLKWYVQDGDTIVDFCCGANDFSCLMREGLHKMGKICSFKNYDLLTPKNDFNFEQKDWMTLTSEELPAGSNLIMGLNPPFGVNGNLANKFIDKALTFKPKLLILIVPIETERLDRKKESPYDNIWEDHHLLSGKAFYLPGSVDENGKQLEQHNNLAPPLYLWSRPDWTTKHKTIAETCGHGTVTYAPSQMGTMDTGENHDGMYEDMEVDSPIYFPSNRPDQKNSHEWNSKGFYPSRYMTGLQRYSCVSDAAAMGMQHPYVVSDAMQGVYHEDLPQYPSVVCDAVEGVHQGAFPPSRQYATEPCLYPEWPGF